MLKQSPQDFTFSKSTGGNGKPDEESRANFRRVKRKYDANCANCRLLRETPSWDYLAGSWLCPVLKIFVTSDFICDNYKPGLM